jgi:hypothetical protein
MCKQTASDRAGAAVGRMILAAQEIVEAKRAWERARRAAERKAKTSAKGKEGRP